MRILLKSIGLFIKKYRKNLFLLLLLLFCFSPKPILDVSYAQDNATQEVQEIKSKQEQLVYWNNFLQVVSSFTSVLLWPLIALAGLTMDNQLIYGSFMHLDSSLWSIWQIVRTFANYALGLIFLVAILLYNLSPQKKIAFGSFLKGISGPADLIKKTLIASILIQASWFILMAMVDLSTVLTYSVGAIPTTLVSTFNEEENNAKLLQTNVMFNLGNEGLQNSSIDDVILYYWTLGSGSSVAIAPCSIAKVGSGANVQSFIIGRAFDKLVDYKGVEIDMSQGYCVHMGELYSFADVVSKPREDYLEYMNHFKSNIKFAEEKNIQALVDLGLIYPLSIGKIQLKDGVNPKQGSIILGGDHYSSNGLASGCDIFGKVPSNKSSDGYRCLYKDSKLSISNIIDKSKSMVGPFSALYSNVINFADLETYTSIGSWQKFVLVLINSLFGILLLLPLLALVVVLFVRIGVLWIAISLSPFIALLFVFEKSDTSGVLPAWVKPGELIKLLLAPVLISFAVSISLVFMTALKNTLGSKSPVIDTTSEQQKDPFYEIAGVRKDTKDGSFSVLGFMKIHLNNGLISLSWIITLFFGLGLTWFLLFWAIKQTKIGASVGNALQKFGEKTLGTLPIIPIGDSAVGLNSVRNFTNTALTNNAFINDMEKSNNEVIQAMFDKDAVALKKERVFNKQLHDYIYGTKTYTQSFTPNFKDNFGESVESLDRFFSSLDSSSKQLNSQQQEELSQIFTDGLNELKEQGEGISSIVDTEEKNNAGGEVKQNVEKLLNLAESRGYSLFDRVGVISIGDETYFPVRKEGTISLAEFKDQKTFFSDRLKYLKEQGEGISSVFDPEENNNLGSKVKQNIKELLNQAESEGYSLLDSVGDIRIGNREYSVLKEGETVSLKVKNP